jgi:hypothetical protein
MERDALLSLWREGVPLATAWLVLVDERIATHFFELRRAGSHLEQQRFLQSDLIARLRDGKLQAIGIQEGSDAGPILIPEYYFVKTAQFDWENDVVTAAGKVFHGVRVKWEREPGESTRWIHPRELEARWELGPPTELEGFVDPSEQWEQELLDEALPRDAEPPDKLTVERETLSSDDAPPIEPLPEKHDNAPSKTRGRPSKVPEIERAIDILLKTGVDLANMPRSKAYKKVRECAAKELNSNIKIGFADPVIHRSLFRRFGQLR